ncbi:hypothetical protein BJV74DRAFT_909226, partial [Russula compacta]
EYRCLASVFHSLPLHAIGPIRSDGRKKLYFSDLYIPWYTPMLSALIKSRKPSMQALDSPSMLLTVQPDAQMPSSLEEMHVVQTICPLAETLSGRMATPNCHSRAPQGTPICSHLVPWDTRGRKAIQYILQTLSRCSPHATRHSAISTFYGRIRFPFCLKYSRDDGGKYRRRGTAPYCGGSIQRILKRCWDNVGNGGHQWTSPH